MRPADAANMIHDLPPERRTAVVAALDDERLADVLEELPEEDQVEILEHLDSERAADVLEEMSPDDAADLIADLPPETAATLLELMEPDEAEDVRRLMSYDENTAGAHDDPRAGDPRPRRDHRRRAGPRPQPRAHAGAGRAGLRLPPAARDARPAGSSASPTSSGCCASRRRPWSAAALDDSMDPLRPDATMDEVAAHLATYNLVAAPVVDDEGRLLGAVTVDDLLDHMLPEDWRDRAPRPGPSRHQRRAPRAAGGDEPPAPRLDTPRETRRQLVRRPERRRGRVRRLRRVVRPLHGHREVPDLHDAVRHRLGRCGTPLAPARPALRRLPLHLPDADAQPAGVVRRPADPARAEPAGAPRQGDRRAGPPGQRPRPRRHGVPGPRGGLAADGGRRGRHPRLPALRAARAAQRPRGADPRRAAESRTPPDQDSRPGR